MKYLIEVEEGHFYLDHRLTPEVRGMFCAMASRAPLGGIKARYAEVVDAVAESIHDARFADLDKVPWKAKDQGRREEFYSEAEDRLCEYPLHARVQGFFDLFVGKYGHSSVMELVGSPSTYTEGVSWYTAYRSFDNELVSGQEFSTRAVRHRNWPMARECFDRPPITTKRLPGFNGESPADDPPNKYSIPNPVLAELHDEWLEVFEADVEAWRIEFTSACPECGGSGQATIEIVDYPSDNAPGTSTVVTCQPCKGSGKKYPTADKEPFRPALDKARGYLAGTIATGFSHTANLRVMARVINDGTLLAQSGGCEAAVQVWKGLAKTYAAAMPGLAGKGLKEAVYTPGSSLPAHLHVGEAEDGPEVEVTVKGIPAGASGPIPARVLGQKAYLDPIYNQLFRVGVAFRCSLAVARDWHRHRTLMPWLMSIVWEHVAYVRLVRDDGSTAEVEFRATEPNATVPAGTRVLSADGMSATVLEDVPFEKVIKIHHGYEPKSDLAKARLTELIRKSSKAFHEFAAAGDHYRAMLCLPLGTLVKMQGQGGLRNVVYMLELRRDAVGANFEYKAQAEQAVALLTEQLREFSVETGGETSPLPAYLGLPEP